MPVRLEQLVASLGAHGVTPLRLAIGFSVFLVSLLGSIALAAAVLVRLPAAYFTEDENQLRAERRQHWLRVVGKNLLGFALVAVGVVLSIPGIPGQGLLTILIGVMLLDIPGKRSLERKIVSRRGVLGAINRLRTRYGREPLRI